MSTDMTWQTSSTSLDDTYHLAEQIGQKLKGGEVIELISDLGGGKTAFVRGLAKGMGSQDAVRSPSFTLSNEYRAAKLTLYHFDFYRLIEPGILREELAEILNDDRAVVAIEWAEIVENVLPADRVTVKVSVTGENNRLLDFAFPAKMKYLFPGKT